MKGFRFYAEYDSNKQKRMQRHTGIRADNVIAIDVDTFHYQNGNEAAYEGFSAVFGHPNSSVAWGGISRHYIDDRCKRISEAKARELHPVLFARLEA
jgi:hypothetical protein